MNKEYYNKNIDFSKRKIINGNFRDQIRDWELHLNLFRDELVFWFELLERTKKSQEKNYLKKPICIELYEYCICLKRCKKLLNQNAKCINELHKKVDNSCPVIQLNNGIDTILNKSQEYLREPRSKYAAHRFTHKNKDFLTVDEIIYIIKNISNKKLLIIREDLFKCHDDIINWINSYGNYFIILNKN